jgi:hypothetical protein
MATIATPGLTIKVKGNSLTIGKDYLIKRGPFGFSCARFVGVTSDTRKFSRDHYHFKSYRTGRIVTLKSLSALL